MQTHLVMEALIRLFPKKILNCLAICVSLILCWSSNALHAQTTAQPKSESEPVDPVREKQKEVYFKNLKQGEITPVENTVRPAVEPVDPAREQQKAEYFAGQQSNLPEALPVWKDTGNHETDEAAYREAVNGWIERNGHLYDSEEIEFLLKPIVKLEDRERTLKNL